MSEDDFGIVRAYIHLAMPFHEPADNADAALRRIEAQVAQLTQERDRLAKALVSLFYEVISYHGFLDHADVRMADARAALVQEPTKMRDPIDLGRVYPQGPKVPVEPEESSDA